MTYEEAVNLKRFDHHCTCGGFAARMNGRDPDDPHMAWCPQQPQHAEYIAALKRGKEVGR